MGLLALGLPAKEFPQHEGWLLRNARLVMAVAIVLFAAVNLWLLRRRARLAAIVAACLVQVAAVAYLFLIRFPEAKTTLPLVLRFEPDLGQMTLVLVGLAAWSVVRAGVALIQATSIRNKEAIDAR